MCVFLFIPFLFIFGGGGGGGGGMVGRGVGKIGTNPGTSKFSVPEWCHGMLAA